MEDCSVGKKDTGPKLEALNFWNMNFFLGCMKGKKEKPAVVRQQKKNMETIFLVQGALPREYC